MRFDHPYDFIKNYSMSGVSAQDKIVLRTIAQQNWTGATPQGVTVSIPQQQLN